MSEEDKDTELKIKEAARKIFQEKGFAATKTRDISEAANINLALLNYYFRSKKKLFDIIMVETLQSFFSGLIHLLNNEESTLKDKVILFVDHYMDFFASHPNVPSFILNAVRENPNEFINKIGVLEQAKGSVFVKQFQEGLMAGAIPPINPIHFMLNLIGLVAFPYIAQPMISAAVSVPKDVFFEMIEERKRLIPLWVESMLSVT
jgi:AcrR family transcriptional regulator